MRRLAVVGLVVVAACTGGQEPAPTSPLLETAPPIPAPSSSVPSSTSTVEPTTDTSPATTSIATTIPLPLLQSLAYQEIADLPFPVQVTARPGDDISYVITKDGVVWGMVDGQILAEPVLDISNRVLNSGERGLLSIALHPTDRPFLYLHYSNPVGATQVSEFRFSTPTEIDSSSERSLLTQDQPARNHNGGMLLFHPDGRLLVGLGDGGGSGDRFNNGQNTDTLLGGIVALNVTGDPDPTLFAYGLRNPWRFWIDEDIIYIADVGQNAYEEVSVTPLAADQNFGWPITEGLHCFRSSSGCDTAGLTLPLIEIRQGDAGTCSVTGGVVYRAEEIPELAGHYLYSDYCGGYLRSFSLDEMGQPLTENDWTDQVGVAGRVTSFGIDGSGEVYVTTTRSLLRLVAIR